MSNYTDNGPLSDDPWDFSILVGSWTILGNLHRFTLEAQAVGTPTESPAQGPREFYVDNINPLANVTFPVQALINELPGITGTATDDSVDGPVPATLSAPLPGASRHASSTPRA